MKKYFILVVLTLLLGIIFVGCQETFNPTTPTLNILKNTTPNNSIECLDFSAFSAGASVEGMDTVYTGLNIWTDYTTTVTDDGSKEAVVIIENASPRAYGSHPTSGSSIINGCLGTNKGIAIQRNTFPENDLYDFIFEFSEDVTVNSFSLNILDFGDYNPFGTTSHSIALVAYDSDGIELTRDTLSYDSNSGSNPTTSTEFGNLQNSGDACRAIGLGGNLPGNYTFNVNSPGIKKVALELGDPADGTDTYFGIRNICFTIEEAIEVPLDIKPTSCPNPINTKSNGVIPVAILGTEDFDVTQIDPVTLEILGVPPLTWAYEDVATPFDPEGYTGDDCNACSTEGPDGYTDLTLKFDAAELIPEIQDLAGETIVMTELTDLEATTMDIDGLCIWLSITGNLLEEFGSTPIYGEDVVRILQKGKK